jgi:predicted RNA-binding protein YlqC (UPF0109 family)
MINANKLKEKVNNGKQADELDSDFSVGTIAGMEEESKPKKRAESKETKNTTNKEESVADMTTATKSKNGVEVTENVTDEMLKDTVSLKVKKTATSFIKLIVSSNDNVIVQEFDNCYQLNAPQIKVSRQDAERAIGKLNDGRWRMMFMNRTGEVVSLNDYEFVLGVLETEIEERKELAQLNTRILAEAKAEMDETRKLLGMTQAEFLEIAIRDFADKVNAEVL